MSAERIAVGVDFGGTRIKLGLVSERGVVRHRALRPTPRTEGALAVFAAIVDGVEELVKDAGFLLKDVAGVGLGTPGPISPEGDRVLFATNIPGWEGFPLKSRMEERLGRPVFLENDANAAALGEYWVGAGRDVRTLIFLGLGTGVGGGLVLDGRPWRGAHRAGAELGHITLRPEGGDPCGCGNRGCLETLAAAPAIVRAAGRALEQGGAPKLREILRESGPAAEPRPELVARAARMGDADAARVYADAGRWLGIGVALYINVFDPEMVIIGGGVAGAFDLLLPVVTEEVRRRSFAAIHQQVSIVPAQLGDDAGVVGAVSPFFVDSFGEMK